MLKALLMASVIIGAFLFQPAQADETLLRCPLGGAYQVIDGIHMCTQAAPFGEKSFARGRSNELFEGRWPNPAHSAVETHNYSYKVGTCTYQQTVASSNIPATPQSFTITTTTSESCPGLPTTHTPPSTKTVSAGPNGGDYFCPPDNATPGTFYKMYPVGSSYICWHDAAHPDNDNDCPDTAVGGCEDPPKPDCFMAGNGMEVCPSDPDEKCTSYVQDGKTYYDCPTNCGFIQDMFYCTKEPDIPDIPDMSHCFKVATGYACPSDSPNPDDTLDNPNKPMPDMTKGDFKETNKGIETRLNATNKLLGDLTGYGAANNQALADLNSKQLAANGFLRDIRQNTAATAGNTADIKDALTGDGMDLDDNHRGLIGGALGITGDESIDDLTKEEITLDSFRSEFQWSGGGGSCPAPRQINILGASFQVDWQPYCSAFAVASHFILAAAYFFAAFIAFGGRK